MAVYYKFKSAKDYDSIAIDGHFITVGQLKEKIFESKHFGRGNDFDLVVTNAQTNEEYLDEATMVPKNTSVLISRIPGRPRMNIVTQPVEPMEEKKPVEPEPVKNIYSGGASVVMNYPDDTEWDEFGNDLYAIPEMLPMHPINPTQDGPPPSKAEEDSKIKALIETPALDWQLQGPDGFGAGRGFGRGMGMGGRMMNGRGFGPGPGRFGLTSKTPPPGYVCHRCKTAGHFIQHCQTNGDPNYDIKRTKPPTGIPKSMLMATPDGPYALPSGAVAVLRPNEAAFEKEIEGLPSTRFVGELPPELHCPLCKEVMKDAVLTSKCCFQSFCDKCIRDFIISKSRCVCEATNVLADDLLPNKTVRDTINRILETNNNSSQDNAGSIYHVQDMESARPPPKVPSPSLSAASKGQSMPPPRNEEIPKMQDTVSEGYVATTTPQQIPDKGMTVKIADVSETTHDSMNVKESASQRSAPHMEEEVQQKVASTETGKKKKKKKVAAPLNGAEMQWMPNQNVAPENFMVPMGPPAGYNPYWNGMQPGMDPYMTPYGGPMPFPGYMPGQFDMPFGGMMQHGPFAPQGHMNMMHQDPFGNQGHMMPFLPPQRDLADFGRGMNAPPPIMSREEFEARKADLRRKRELEKRDFVKDREYGNKVSSNGEMQPKSKSGVQSSAADYNHDRRRSEKPLPERLPARELDQPPRPPKRKSSADDRDYYDDRDRERERGRDRDHHSHRSESSTSAARGYSETKPSKSSSSAAVDAKHKPSVFNRISFPEEEVLKKRKVSSSSSDAAAQRDHRDRDAAPVSSSSSHRHSHRSSSSAKTTTRKSSSSSANVAAAAAMEYDYESSDEDRHFKRRPSRYEPSPPPLVHHSEYDRGDRYSKHR